MAIIELPCGGYATAGSALTCTGVGGIRFPQCYRAYDSIASIKGSVEDRT